MIVTFRWRYISDAVCGVKRKRKETTDRHQISDTDQIDTTCSVILGTILRPNSLYLVSKANKSSCPNLLFLLSANISKIPNEIQTLLDKNPIGSANIPFAKYQIFHREWQREVNQFRFSIKSIRTFVIWKKDAFCVITAQEFSRGLRMKCIEKEQCNDSNSSLHIWRSKCPRWC